MNTKEQHIIIDAAETRFQKQSVAKEAILWWEKKRWLYNVLTISGMMFLIYDFWDYPMRGIIGERQIILEAFIIVIGVNVFYALGWILELAVQYFFKAKGLHPIARWSLFVLGTISTFFMLSIFYGLKFDVLFA